MVPMKSFLLCLVSLLVTMLYTQPSSVDAFIVPTISYSSSQSLMTATTTTTTTQLHFFGGGPKDDGSPGDYKCLDCNYVFTQGPKAWNELPANWSCPECGSVKRRFKKVPKGSIGSGKGKTSATTSSTTPAKKKGIFGF
ncbi:flavin reductase like protein [Nitzschia inconspicua]|uniref:Flavin reductase like protein n=1 Tax=Nitzschia inconspicua TaxID=303405 RepID=A0A9K3P7A0_9STRA|nr:flavin reductase like protein [Nitzschia inconspicua]KAG7336882.1 flavin reductase like protein [Nitzschia inconspicua]KAG7337033.1 flavin reductase like protein [Nitzschia inconspicua]KAG7344680.1 flavin reductase like protein [Nitzschia inconspicua]